MILNIRKPFIMHHLLWYADDNKYSLTVYFIDPTHNNGFEMQPLYVVIVEESHALRLIQSLNMKSLQLDNYLFLFKCQTAIAFAMYLSKNPQFLKIEPSELQKKLSLIELKNSTNEF